MNRLARYAIMVFEFGVVFFLWINTIAFLTQGATECSFQAFYNGANVEECINSLPYLQKNSAIHPGIVLILAFIIYLSLLFLTYYLQDKYLPKRVNKQK